VIKIRLQHALGHRASPRAARRVNATWLSRLTLTVLSTAMVVAGCSPEAPTSDAAPLSDGAAADGKPVPVVVIGDSYTSGSDVGGLGDANWTAVMARDVAAAGIPLRLTVSGRPGSGYLTEGGEGTTFLGEARGIVTPDDRVVVVFGSRNDEEADVTTAAEATFEAIERNAPGAKVIAIAPFPTTGETNETNTDVPRYLRKMIGQLRVAATRKNVTFVDPIRDGWFFGRPDLIGSDTWHPNDAGHRHMADKITPIVLAAIRR
jgi:lysophospholipase L1-like esterase